MDNNQNHTGNPFHLDESSTGENKHTESGLGYDPKTFGTAGSNQTGTYNANPYNNQTGTYDAGGTAALQASQDEAYAKKAKTSLILGIILNVLNLGMICSTLFGDGFLYGGLFIILAIAGIQNANLGRKSSQKGMATAGLVLNIIAVVFSALFLILGLVLKFMD